MGQPGERGQGDRTTVCTSELVSHVLRRPEARITVRKSDMLCPQKVPHVEITWDRLLPRPSSQLVDRTPGHRFIPLAVGRVLAGSWLGRVMVYTVPRYRCDSMFLWRLTEPSIFEHTVGYYSLVRSGLTLLAFPWAESLRRRLKVGFFE